MLNSVKEQFQKEQNDLLMTVLNGRYFSPWKSKNPDDQYNLRRDSNLEIYVTNICNQKCEYCYLTKYDGLYPSELRSPELLLKNLRMLFDYLIENNMHIAKADYFTGEIWHTQFGLDILEISLEYIKKGLQVDWWMIASNCSFVMQDESLHRIQHYIDEFKRYGSQLVFSISIDGKIIEEQERPMNDGTIKTDEDYDKYFCFAKHNGFGFHPMVASKSVGKWIENHKWFEKKMKEYDMNDDIHTLMMLEVRNNDWTDETIQQYNEFMDYLIEKYIVEACNNDIKIFANTLMITRRQNKIGLGGYVPWCFPESDSFIGCTCATDMCVRLGDLAICPCHRTAYNKYIYGYFDVENDKITGITANNPQMAIKILMSNFNGCIHGCDSCVFCDYCLKGCFGAQIESVGDPFIPNPTVCKFFKEKYGHLIQKYKDLGVIDYYRTFTPYEEGYERVKKFLNMVDRWEEKNCNGMGK